MATYTWRQSEDVSWASTYKDDDGPLVPDEWMMTCPHLFTLTQDSPQVAIAPNGQVSVLFTSSETTKHRVGIHPFDVFARFRGQRRFITSGYIEVKPRQVAP